jgi:hypothetical protein
MHAGDGLAVIDDAEMLRANAQATRLATETLGGSASLRDGIGAFRATLVDGRRRLPDGPGPETLRAPPRVLFLLGLFASRPRQLAGAKARVAAGERLFS